MGIFLASLENSEVFQKMAEKKKNGRLPKRQSAYVMAVENPSAPI
jgi:hypothetical protein